MNKEQKKMLYEISMIDFAIVEMNLYLDTHPCDTETIAYITQYNRVKSKMMQEYANRYWPLSVRSIMECENEWTWALTPLPWEGECR